MYYHGFASKISIPEGNKVTKEIECDASDSVIICTEVHRGTTLTWIRFVSFKMQQMLSPAGVI